MSWRTPEKVLKRWEWEHGLTDFAPEKLEPFFEKVEERVSVRPQDPESVGRDAALMLEGAGKLGYKWVPAMRSQKHCAGINNCAFGCPTDAKQSVLVTYVPRTLKAGGQLFSGCRVERIVTDGHRATGVIARFCDPETGRRGPRVTVRARWSCSRAARSRRRRSCCAIAWPTRPIRSAATSCATPTPR